MPKRSCTRTVLLLCTISWVSLIYLLFHPELFDFLLSNPLYGYSILLFIASFVLVSIIVSKSTVFSPSLFLLLFFMAVPLLGVIKAKQYFSEVGTYFWWTMPSFDFPTLLWSIGAVAFFGGVLFGWLLLPKSRPSVLVLWDHGRMVLFLSISVVLATLGTILAYSRIGYIPLLKFDIGDFRVDYFKTVGPLTSKFAAHWPVPAVLSSMLFFLEKSNKKYIYLCITIMSGIATMFYGQRTGFVWVMSVFGLMYCKFSRPRLLQLVAVGTVAVVLVYGLMRQAEYRSGADATHSQTGIAKYGFFEWSQYSIVVNEARSSGKYLGWKIVVGPFLTFVPRQIHTVFGQDKGALMLEYSAAYYYGKVFDEPYGIRVTPIGEAFAAYGISGVIVQMLLLGVVFGALERAYFSLDKRDARLSLVCYGLSLMTHLPITTMWVLLTPLTVTGVFVVMYYFFGARIINSLYIRRLLVGVGREA